MEGFAAVGQVGVGAGDAAPTPPRPDGGAVDARGGPQAGVTVSGSIPDAGPMGAGGAEPQLTLFDPGDIPPDWREKWRGMPEFEQANMMPWQSVAVHFRNATDRAAFAAATGLRLTDMSDSIWYPPAVPHVFTNRRYVTAEAVAPRYPVYIVSKGRAESRMTSKALEKMRVPYKIVIEPHEFDAYAAVIDPAKILTLPFSNLGLGSIPARNWIWEHAAIDVGADRHWILDDNISGFYRLHNNLKMPVWTGATFRAAEDFCDRYENVGIAGFNYHTFANQRLDGMRIAPFRMNTRIYSCILIDNWLPHRWRGRYNEDTDLCIRALKDGVCTVLFNAFLAMKHATMTMKGGNTDELYKDDGRLRMAESLRDQHPDIVRIAWKWGRWQHHVDYSGFRANALRLRPGAVIPDGVENYGMELDIDGEAA